MIIDTSYVGMDSARTYKSSVTRKFSHYVSGGEPEKKASGAQKEISEEGPGLLTGKEEQENAQDQVKKTDDSLQDTWGTLGKTGMIRRIREVGVMEQRSAIEEIRQNCLLYLWSLLFGGKKAEELADKMGMSQYSSGFSGNSEQLSLQMPAATAVLRPVQTLTVEARQETYYEETEETSFTTQGMVRTADGREITFQLDLGMSRSFAQYTSETFASETVWCDPLVINLNGNIAEVSDQKFFFDLDADGEEEAIAQLCGGSGYLALDHNGDGKVNDGSELFGTKNGDGFADLARYDEDGNGWIDENDEVFDKLQIWIQEEDGSSRLYRLADKGVGAICLQRAGTEFTQRDSNGDVSAAIRNTGIFLYENGMAGTVQHLDLAVAQLQAMA